MTNSDIRFPEALRSALRDGRLVVFAGAGVSQGSPAHLPNFETLANSIAEGSGETRRDGESDDAFLGRLHKSGVRVHERAVQFLRTNLRDKTPIPTQLHRDLVRLYPHPGKVRIVTTNFDALFLTASRNLFSDEPDLYRAPALPLGHDFNGIVHLHGHLDRQNAMVLTDADFGRAYLTDSWASRFLVELFRTFTVMFVGYSHNDTVMRYLARALPESDAGKRFILTDETDDIQWSILGIEPVYFPKGDYDRLNTAIRKLADYASRGLLDWRREINEIARRPPSPDPSEADTMRDALDDPTKTRFFTEVATDPEWIDWLEEHGHLDPLFATELLSESDGLLAAWLVDRFAFACPEALFLLVANHKMSLNPQLWRDLLLALVYRANFSLNGRTLSRWVSCLLATAPPLGDMQLLLSLGQRCIQSCLIPSLLEIFEAMSRHGLSLQPPFSKFEADLLVQFDLPREEIQVELSPNDDNFAFNQLWETGLKPHVADVAEPLLTSLAANLAARHRTFVAWQKADRDSDPDNWSRESIEPGEQYSRFNHVDVLVDVAHHCLQWLANNRPQAAASWCELFIPSAIPLLRRLGVHALSLRTDLSAGGKLDWLCANANLHDNAAGNELSRLLHGIYPQLDPQGRERTIASILDYNLRDDDNRPKELPTARYHVYWLELLQDADPSCNLVRAALDKVTGPFPELLAHDQPTPIRPLTIKTLLSRAPSDWVDEWYSDTPESLGDQERHDVLATVTQCAQRDFRWSAGLADALAARQRWNSDLWTSLFRAWCNATLTDEQVAEIFEYLGESALSAARAARIAKFLLTWIEQAGTPLATDLLSQANQIAASLWTFIDADPAAGPCESWHSQAIGRPAGNLARYWMTQTSLLHNHPEPMPATFLGEVRAALLTIAKDSTNAGRQGRSVLAAQLAFLVDAEERWTQDNLIHRFVEYPGSDDYQAVWDGFLTSGRLTIPVGSLLKTAFLEAPRHILTRIYNGGILRGFVNRYTVMIVHFADDPVTTWIPEFFRYANDNACRQFASEIQGNLRHLNDAQQREAWDRWLKPYWEHRLDGIPKPLDDAETRHMFALLPALGTLFPTAVELALGMPPVSLAGSPLISDLRRGNHKCDAPEAVAKLLVHLSEHASPDPAWYRAKELIELLLCADLPEDLARQLQELLARL